MIDSIIFLQIEQLSDQVGEEAVLLTASVTDGSSSHLGSQSGKVFAEDHAEIRSQFLGYCLKSELHNFRGLLKKLFLKFLVSMK